MNKIIILVFIFLIPPTCFADSADTFWGTYQGFSRACQTSFLVLDQNTVSIDECKKSSYTLIESDEDHILIEIKPSSRCNPQVIKIEHEKSEYLFGGFVVEIYENLRKAQENNASVTCSYGLVDPSMAEDQTLKFLNGKTEIERKDALHKINLQLHPERDKYNELGLHDTSPDVRETAAWFLRGNPDHFVPMLINLIAHDPDSIVRASAGYSLSHFYTDNDADGYLYITPLEKGLDELLIGLKDTDIETLRSIVEILGSRYVSESVAPCYMSVKNRKKVTLALKEKLKTIRFDEAKNEIINAIDNINKCGTTKH